MNPDTETPQTATPETKGAETKGAETKGAETNRAASKRPETKAADTSAPDSRAPDTRAPNNGASRAPAPDTISQNIASIAAFYRRKHQKVAAPQLFVERLSRSAARPSFLAATVLFVLLWILANLGAQLLNLTQFDPKPYHLLHAVISVLALLTATMVLIRQERQAKIDQLSDLPMVADRYHGDLQALQQASDPQRMLAEIDAVGIAVNPTLAAPTEIRGESA